MLAQTLDMSLLPRRTGADAFSRGVTFEVAGAKTENAKGAVNSAISAERWKAMLGSLNADPVWVSGARTADDHMGPHRAAVSRCRRGCGALCLLLLVAVVCAALAGAGVFGSS